MGSDVDWCGMVAAGVNPVPLSVHTDMAARHITSLILDANELSVPAHPLVDSSRTSDANAVARIANST